MVVCNKCDKIIEHHRYNCIQCLDYDLCMECESKFIHEDHLMLRISAKVSKNFICLPCIQPYNPIPSFRQNFTEQICFG